MTSLKNASSIVLVLLASACGGTVGLGDLFDGGTAGSTGSSSGSGTTSGSSGSTTGGTTVATTGSGSGTSGSGTSGSGTSGSSGPGTSGSSAVTTGAGGATTVGGTTGAGGAPATGGAGGAGGAPNDVVCGGLLGRQCATGSYCDFPTGSSCGAADQTGVCRPKPEVCTADCPGACGCDGKFYCNACVAHTAGVDDTTGGNCIIDPPAPPPDAGSGQICGGIRGATCAANSYCSFTAAAICGFADATGVCRPRPQGCTADCPGVCGCDGKFYCNACTAQGMGVDVNANDRSCLRRDN
jgi:hypothetical protein